MDLTVFSLPRRVGSAVPDHVRELHGVGVCPYIEGLRLKERISCVNPEMGGAHYTSAVL
jgi:hypothetical protein